MNTNHHHRGIQISRSIFCALVLTVCLSGVGRATELKQFEKLINLLESNLYNYDVESVDAAAVEGLLRELEGQVIHTPEPGESDVDTPPKSKSLKKVETYDDAFLYLQIGSIDEGADSELQEAITSATSGASQPEGIILDFRFAEGRAYTSVPSVVGLFHPGRSALFSMKGESFESSPSSDPVNLPLAILVNSETSRAAELAAASFKQIRKAIIIGQKSSGQTFYFEKFELDGGGTLEVARSPVEMADGSPLSQAGIEPDIRIDSPLDLQRKYLEDPYYIDPNSERPMRTMTEADLIRLKNQQIARAAGEFSPDLEVDPETGESDPVPETGEFPRTINDPILSRGIDFLKGIRFMRQLRGR